MRELALEREKEEREYADVDLFDLFYFIHHQAHTS